MEEPAGQAGLRVSIAIDGGLGFFPGLARPRTVAFERMPADVQTRLRALLAAVDFFRRGDDCDGKGADRRTYVIEIADAGRIHTVRATEPIGDPDLALLVKLLRDYAR